MYLNPDRSDSQTVQLIHLDAHIRCQDLNDHEKNQVNWKATFWFEITQSCKNLDIFLMFYDLSDCWILCNFLRFDC